jgi:shikimate kinase
MATGGGTPCFFNNIEVMNLQGNTLFLNPPLSEIFSRLQKTDLKERPLFAGLTKEGVIEKLESLYSKRILFYQQAKIFLVKESLTAKDVLLALKE